MVLVVQSWGFVGFPLLIVDVLSVSNGFLQAFAELLLVSARFPLVSIGFLLLPAGFYWRSIAFRFSFIVGGRGWL